jgi:hypothetical protein
MELLNKDTKPCPSCGTMIFRISGCSQMFCVDCHAAWDWNTERIVKGVIHNPHYYDFIRNGGGGGGGGGRNHGDIPCGGLPPLYEVRNCLNNLNDNRLNINIVGTVYTNYIFFNIHNCITHIEQHELRVFNDDGNNIETNRGLRIKYLLNEISEADFKTTLQQCEKKRQKMTEFRNIYQMFIDVGSDIFRQIIVSTRSLQSRQERIDFILEQAIILNNLKKYFNESLQKLGKMFKCVYPGLNENYEFENNIETWNKRIQRNQQVTV